MGGKDGIWTYSSANPTGDGGGTRRPAQRLVAGAHASASAVDPLAAVTKATAALRLDRHCGGDRREQTAAGRQSYTLTVTPAAGTTTTFGYLRVAIDGATYVPLQVQVYAKGDTTPALSAGFTSVSYAKNDASLFSFTPPAGATVQHKALPSMPSATSGVTAPARSSPLRSRWSRLRRRPGPTA